MLGTVEPVGLIPRPHTKGALALRLVQYAMLQQNSEWLYYIGVDVMTFTAILPGLNLICTHLVLSSDVKDR